MSWKIKKNIRYLEKSIADPKKGLPDDIFYFIGRMTPYVNVDLLIQSPIHGTLLTWREDLNTGSGWHIPGGIIRFKEKIKDRIFKVGITEIGINILKFKGPLEFSQLISHKKERSHFISLLYQCEITVSQLKEILRICKKNKGIKFFKKVPKKMLKLQVNYKKFIKKYNV